MAGLIATLSGCFSEGSSGTETGSEGSSGTETGSEGSSGTETGSEGSSGTETGSEGSEGSSGTETGTEGSSGTETGTEGSSGTETGATLTCGDGVLQPEELCEPGSVLPGTEFVCNDACVFDFSSVPQLYCYASCSYAGPIDCDQADADVYCRLITGNPTSIATSYQITAVLDQGGFSCPGMGVDLGPMQLLGVPGNVWYQSTSLLANHGGGYAVTGVVCR